jgi:hypothetical protein
MSFQITFSSIGDFVQLHDHKSKKITYLVRFVYQLHSSVLCGGVNCSSSGDSRVPWLRK